MPINKALNCLPPAAPGLELRLSAQSENPRGIDVRDGSQVPLKLFRHDNPLRGIDRAGSEEERTTRRTNAPHSGRECEGDPRFRIDATDAAEDVRRLRGRLDD